MYINRRLSTSIALIGATLVTMVAVSKAPTADSNAFCSCADTVTLDTQLPMSHPINRCANQQVSDVSWSSWFSGQRNSGQFHYLNLLELLSRHSDKTKQKPSNS